MLRMFKQSKENAKLPQTLNEATRLQRFHGDVVLLPRVATPHRKQGVDKDFGKAIENIYF